jgi:SAM-dependent methyltransferase
MSYHDGYDRSAPYYDLFDTKDNIDFFYHYAKPAGIIADIGAGTGRIAVPLAQQGITVYCVEPSCAMLREFKKKLAENSMLNEKIILQRRDAATFSFDRLFPAVFLSGTFDHFLKDDERIAALTNIHRHLTTNGKIIFDVFLGLMKDSPLHPAGRVSKGTTEYKRSVKSTIRQAKRMDILLVYETYERGTLTQRIEQQSRAAVVTRRQIHEVLTKTGFVVRNEYCDYHDKKFTPGDDLLIIEAEKREP